MRDSMPFWLQRSVNPARCGWAAAAALALPLLIVLSGAANAQTGGATRLAGEPRNSASAQLRGTSTAPLELSMDQALWAAIAFEDANQVRELLKGGANANVLEGLSQMTPLMAAETFPIASILIQNGANPNARDRNGRTPLHYAVLMRDAATIVPLLVRAGADVNARTGDAGRDTPLIAAVEKYAGDQNRDTAMSASIIRALVHLGADVNATDARGETSLAIAARENKPELIRLLIELGADPAKRLGNGRTPMDYAREVNAQDAIRALAVAAGKVEPAN